jgi:hypothetical protein
MTTAIAEIETLISRKIGDPIGVHGQTVALKAVATQLKTSIPRLVEEAQKQGVPVQQIGPNRHVRSCDLARLIGEEPARLVRLDGRPPFTRADPATQFYICVAKSEWASVCRLRGVEESYQGGSVTFSTLGLIALQAILESELKQELRADDWIPWRDALEKLREIQDWRRADQVHDFDSVKPGEQTYARLMLELEARCEASGVRKKISVHRRQRGETVVCAYDLFRMCSIEMIGKDVELYRLMMIEAFDSVLGQEGVAS